MPFPWILCSILLILNAMLLLKIVFLKKDLDTVSEEFKSCMEQETNHLITVPAHDRHIRKIASEINSGLKSLRRQRQKYRNGDLELKEAAANISHDLRTPLTAVYGYLELLENEEQPEEAGFYIRQIQNRADAMRQLTEELFQYSVLVSSQMGDMEDIVLNRALEECLLGYDRAFAQKNITPVIEMPDSAIHRKADPAAFRRIIENILSNALKYSDGDFYVELKEEGTILFTNSAEGLSPVMVERLFDRFYTLETGRSSTGLGLSIAKLLTERMGGKIEACHEAGKLTVSLKLCG